MNLVRSLLALAVLGMLAGCAQLDLTPEGSPDRTLRGKVTSGVALPAGAQVTVRLIELPTQDNGAPKDQPVPGQMPRVNAERVLAEQQVPAGPGASSVPFQLSFSATDAQLRRGLTLEARVSAGGRLSHRNLQAHVVTLGSVGSSHELPVSPIR
jgi:uncharacterized lipoprotein YbaY